MTMLPIGSGGPTLIEEQDATEAPAHSTEGANTSPDENAMPKVSSYDEDETRPLSLPPVDLTIDRLGDVRLLELAIQCTPDPDDSGRHMTQTTFAEMVALCSGRTMRRYLAGDRSVPALLREKARSIVHAAQDRAIKAAKRERRKRA